MNNLEEVTSPVQEAECTELAELGEFHCSSGDYRTGLRFYEAAIQCGTSNTALFATICSQAAAAAFQAHENERALVFLKQELKVCRLLGDQLAEAKCCSNLANVLKVLRRFDDAATFLEHQIVLLRSHHDQVGECHALFALAGVYHSKGKHIASRSAALAIPVAASTSQMPVQANTTQSAAACRTSTRKRMPATSDARATDSPTVQPVSYPVMADERNVSGEPHDAALRNALLKASELYEVAYKLSEEVGEEALQGRACGNLANAAYMLGDFGKALRVHRLRYQLAVDRADLCAQRRALANAGNAALLLGDSASAIDAYRTALDLVRSTPYANETLHGQQSTFTSRSATPTVFEEDRTTLEAQACFLLATAYLADGQLALAAAYFEEHYRLARRLHDRLGQSRSCAQLANVHARFGNRETAARFARRYLKLATLLEDDDGVQTARATLHKLTGATFDEQHRKATSAWDTPDSAIRFDRRSYRTRHRSNELNLLASTNAFSASTFRTPGRMVASTAQCSAIGETLSDTDISDTRLSVNDALALPIGTTLQLPEAFEPVDLLKPSDFVRNSNNVSKPNEMLRAATNDSQTCLVALDVNAFQVHDNMQAAFADDCNQPATLPKRSSSVKFLSSPRIADTTMQSSDSPGEPRALSASHIAANDKDALGKTELVDNCPLPLDLDFVRVLNDKLAAVSTDDLCAVAPSNQVDQLNTSNSSELNRSLQQDIDLLSCSLTEETDRLNTSIRHEVAKLNASLKQEIERLNCSLLRSHSVSAKQSRVLTLHNAGETLESTVDALAPLASTRNTDFASATLGNDGALNSNAFRNSASHSNFASTQSTTAATLRRKLTRLFTKSKRYPSNPVPQPSNFTHSLEVLSERPQTSRNPTQLTRTLTDELLVSDVPSCETAVNVSPCSVKERYDMFELIDRCASLRYDDQRCDPKMLLRQNVYQAFAKPYKMQIKHSVLRKRRVLIPLPATTSECQLANEPKQSAEQVAFKADEYFNVSMPFIDESCNDADRNRLCNDAMSPTLAELAVRLQCSRLDEPMPTDENCAPQTSKPTRTHKSSLARAGSFLKLALRKSKRRHNPEVDPNCNPSNSNSKPLVPGELDSPRVFKKSKKDEKLKGHAPALPREAFAFGKTHN